MNLVFMGTPDFAVPCLRALAEGGHHILGVYTQPDKPKGRGYQMTFSPVKELALELGLPVFQPTTFKDAAVVEQLRALKPELIVVVAYGKILPKAVLDIPVLGCVNVHGSLLPKYRGAGPIQWSVIRGEKETGITTMFMGEGLDTGDMILKKATPIGEDETAGELFDRLMALGAQCLMETIALFERGEVPREPQNDEASTYAPMLDKKLARLDFSKSAEEIHNLVRGLNPWPVAFTTLGDKKLKVFAAKPAAGYAGEPGRLLSGERLIVGCGGGAVEFLEVALEGKKRMSGVDFLRGRRLEKGTAFGG
ncbi:methionyl-tRNA formyltransferase [Zongyangia hominis]|uniref:Methionyl-tRNA formyltransferase n=1 Tax=Zongyangia hominis TaxID=2763677 RepID=A0A926ICA6_9FIRM|nr:methionyl-tRNA formyltransferase [Zongyangia hominis]MBC8570915.1 methionyl-tRNA formyltransferase [Zongyangia hominis]